MSLIDEVIDPNELPIKRDHQEYIQSLLNKISANQHTAVSYQAFEAVNGAFRTYMDKEFRDEDLLVQKMQTSKMSQLISEGLAIKAPPEKTFLEEIEDDSATLMRINLDYAVGSIYMIRSRCQVVISSSVPDARQALLKERIKGQITEFKKGEVSILFMQPMRVLEQVFNQYTIVELSPDAITKERNTKYMQAFSEIYQSNVLTRCIVNYLHLNPEDMPKETLEFLSVTPKIREVDEVSLAIKNNTLSKVLPITAQLNPSQLQGFKKAWINNGVFLLHGPPGTGKSKTLLAIIAGFLKAGKRLLVTSHTNQAIDKLLEDAHKQRIITPGKAVRIGDMTTQDRDLLKYNLKSACAAVRKNARLRANISYYEASDNPEDTVFANAEAVFATLVGTWKDNLVARFGTPASRKFDVVIIDEASQSHLMPTLMPLSMGLRVIMAGDHKQLPPCLMGDRIRGSHLQHIMKMFAQSNLAQDESPQSEALYKQSLFERMLTKNFLVNYRAKSGYRYQDFKQFNSSDYLVRFWYDPRV